MACAMSNQRTSNDVLMVALCPERNALINIIGKALGHIQNHTIFKKQVLLPPTTTRQGMNYVLLAAHVVLFVNQDTTLFTWGFDEGSVSTQTNNQLQTNTLINIIGKALGHIQNHTIFKKQVLLPPTTTRQESVEEVLKSPAEVNCSHRPSYSRGTHF